LCEKYGCSRGTVQIILNKANISLEEREARRKAAAAESLAKKFKTERSSVAELATLLDD
jgi:hypothetical protein